MDGNITIPLDEYRRLLLKEAAIDSFSKFVNISEYDISREICGVLLGFEVKGASR